MPKSKPKLSPNGRGRKAARRAPARAPIRRSGSKAPDESLVALAESGRLGEAAREEVRAQRAAGMPVTYQVGNDVVKEYPDGRREVLETIPPAPPYKFPKGVGIIRDTDGANGRG